MSYGWNCRGRVKRKLNIYVYIGKVMYISNTIIIIAIRRSNSSDSEFCVAYTCCCCCGIAVGISTGQRAHAPRDIATDFIQHRLMCRIRFSVNFTTAHVVVQHIHGRI